MKRCTIYHNMELALEWLESNRAVMDQVRLAQHTLPSTRAKMSQQVRFSGSFWGPWALGTGGTWQWPCGHNAKLSWPPLCLPFCLQAHWPFAGHVLTVCWPRADRVLTVRMQAHVNKGWFLRFKNGTVYVTV